MKLITETTFNDISCNLNEAKKEGGNKIWTIDGIYLQAELKNGNGRVYPKHILKREAEKYIVEFIKTNGAIGELNHPAYPLPDPAQASHKITSLSEDGNNWIGSANILGTPRGKIVQDLLEGDVRLGVSSRAIGSLKQVGESLMVQEDLQLNTVDIVANPSAPDAFVDGILEGKEWVWENNVLVESDMATLKRKLDEGIKQRKKASDVAVAVFTEFLDKIDLAPPK